MKVSKAEFEAFVKVRDEGEVNMLDSYGVDRLAGIGRDKVRYIVSNFDELAKEFSDDDSKTEL